MAKLNENGCTFNNDCKNCDIFTQCDLESKVLDHPKKITDIADGEKPANCPVNGPCKICEDNGSCTLLGQKG